MFRGVLRHSRPLLGLEQWTEHFRFLTWGFPAAVLVFSAISLEKEYGDRIPKLLLKLGDASYSLYLSHGFIIAAVGATAGVIGMSGLIIQIAATVFGVIASCIVGIAPYEVVEKPLIHTFKKCDASCMTVDMRRRNY